MADFNEQVWRVLRERGQNFHDDQMNSPRSSARLARWSARQATSMPNLTSFMAWSFLRVADQSALPRRPLHVPQGCDHPDIREAGVRPTDRPPSSRKGIHVRRQTITVMESSSRSLRPHFSQARRTDPTHPTKGFRQIGGCPEPTLNAPIRPCTTGTPPYPKPTPSISAEGVMSGRRRIRNALPSPSREAMAGTRSATWRERLRALVLMARTAF